MKKLVILLLCVGTAVTLLQACSNKLCPAYSSYPQKRR